MDVDFLQALIEAEGVCQQDLSESNPYRLLGFDGDKKRLGWMRVIEFSQIKEKLQSISKITDKFDNFIFVGMGGSVNGMKPLFSMLKGSNLYALDSLDPAAVEEIIKSIGDFSKTLIIPITKSGTTKETQAISATLRDLIGENWKNQFLWLADPESFTKIDSFGWETTEKTTIQFDGQNDIGGRFSCPHTLIFMLPLMLLLKKDLAKVEEIYNTYLSHRRQILQQAVSLANKHKGLDPAYFFPEVSKDLQLVFESWLYQLFQESLGSKKDNLAVKTIVCREGNDGMFVPIKLDINISDPTAYLMCQMFFFQVFVALYAGLGELNFVNQDFVEKYKSQMRKLEGEKVDGIAAKSLEEVIESTKSVAEKYKFIDIVLYFHPCDGEVAAIKNSFKNAFADKRIIVVVGSDWNHHSYQATSGDKETFFLFLLAADYKTSVEPINKQILENNIESLKIIGKATYLTLEDKSLFLALKRRFCKEGINE
ncbi:MAG: hypothetical protein GY858_03815 [Candidatus Omnitrophica bacterium]|nr:hypothetical protein [Candidatus Omnitrophota bacterium]